jgi:predicted RNA binding protein YcfA (HicA-like mRNA interferase family)
LPETPRLTAEQAESLLLEAGFVQVRSKGSHRIYRKGGRRVVVPFHSGKVLHPKVIKQVYGAVE